MTLHSVAAFESCPVCFSEDDGQGDQGADVVHGGPNGNLSLTQARMNYVKYAASDPVPILSARKPLPDELASE
jgi:hypothetical protein